MVSPKMPPRWSVQARAHTDACSSPLLLTLSDPQSETQRPQACARATSNRALRGLIWRQEDREDLPRPTLPTAVPPTNDASVPASRSTDLPFLHHRPTRVEPSQALPSIRNARLEKSRSTRHFPNSIRKISREHLEAKWGVTGRREWWKFRVKQIRRRSETERFRRRMRAPDKGILLFGNSLPHIPGTIFQLGGQAIKVESTHVDRQVVE